MISAALFATPAHSDSGSVVKIGTLDTRLPKGSSSSTRPNMDIIMDSPSRLGFQVIKYDDFSTQIRSINLDTGKIVAQRPIARTDIQSGPASPNGDGNSAEWVHAFDYDKGFLYLAYLNGGGLGGILQIDTKTLKVTKNIKWQQVYTNLQRQGCSPGQTSSYCLPQQPEVTPAIKGMAFVPSVLIGQPDKLLLLMAGPKFPGADKNFSVPYLAQWDITNATQDWMYRIQACSNAKLPSSDPLALYQVGVFESHLSSGIYVGCLASGGVGQVVYLPVDSLNVPTTEQAYPGPLATSDVIADEQADRMLLRVINTSGESYWIFDGQSKSYAGVIGLTVAESNTASGLDPLTGRLYFMGPATGSGQNFNPGGLMMSDSRRNPAPQALQFPQFASSAVGKIEVDTNPVTGERRAFVIPGGSVAYTVYEDKVPVTLDAQISDLDALTTDVAEQPGVTGSNFTGGGHAYGLRVRLVGGLNGVPPTGPDANGYRVGRHVPTFVNSPCGYPDREIVVGSVNNAGLTNTLSSAAATVSEIDPGTKTDLGQPAERCYPRPLYPISGTGDFPDLWDFITKGRVGDYPRPLDSDLDHNGKADSSEILGSSWPFPVVECSGDKTQSAPAEAHPLDRGGDKVPSNVKQTPVQSSNYNAVADCQFSKQKVVATAGGAPYSEPKPPTDLGGAITVGDVSANVTSYVDPERGMVSRSIATVNHINIGNVLSIDKAYTIAESWAHGRTGTAGTTFDRRLCGIHIKDLAPGTQVNEPGVNVNVDPNNPTPLPSDPVSVDPQGGPRVNKEIDINTCVTPNYDVSAAAERQAGLGDGSSPLVDVINKALGSRGRASFPSPDGPLSQGTPGGYLASVEKDTLQQISARAVNNDISTEVPALELTVFNDDQGLGRGRQIYQFAGTDASSTYGIYLLNPPCIDCNPPVPPPPPSPIVLPTQFTQPPLPQPGPQSQPQGDNPLTLLYSGVGVLLRRPLDALLAAAVWVILYSPAQLAIRRRGLKAIR